MRRRTATLNRREALQRIGIIGIGSVAAACGGGDDAKRSATPTAAPTATLAENTATATAAADTRTATAPPSATPTAFPTASATPQPSATLAATGTPTPTATVPPSCMLTPQQVLGPFFIDVGLARSDVREDRAGVALRLALQLVDGEGCTPIRDAVVNIWHADAAGAYSGFAGQPGGVDTTGETFLRGFQITDAGGRVEFVTIYPGWYPGRTVHIHVRIHLDATTVLVTQLYFAESINDAVLAQPPYNARGARDTTNASDAIAGRDLDQLLVPLAADDEGYQGAIVLGATRE